VEDPRTRQWQVALVWAFIIVFVSGLHLAPQGRLAAALIAIGAFVYFVRILLSPPTPLKSDPIYRPRVSVLVAARNEEAVIERLVANLCALDYEDFEVWVADDGSTDSTYRKLVEAGRNQPRLQIFRRPEGSRPGKSAVLNDLAAKAKGEILAVFDADAQVEADFLQRTVALFADSQLGAVQARKMIVNAKENFWTRGQAAEMLLDTCQLQQRASIGGTAELRGNGQLVRVEALRLVKGWTEATVTDDLDLSLKLPLAGYDVQFVAEPCVFEEGVTTWESLFRQRSRWAEGGFQRYLDYAEGIFANRMGSSKTFDQLFFGSIQYLMPLAAVWDLLFSLLGGYPPLLTPLVFVATLFTGTAFYLGQRQAGVPNPKAITEAMLGTVYFLHWFPVIVIKMANMVLKPKRLIWVKTTHQGV
jgi:1,2-diacylglycerol 3-beta-glucosyltransferase